MIFPSIVKKFLISNNFLCPKFSITFILLFITTSLLSQQNLDTDNDGILDSEECGFEICAQPIINGDFEDHVINVRTTFVNENDVPGWETNASDNQIEIWRNGTGLGNHSAASGNQFAELNATVVSTLFQQLCLTPATIVEWSVKHKGRTGRDVAEVRIGADLNTAVAQATMSDDVTTWGSYSGNYTVPDGQAETVFAFVSISSASPSASVGNFIDDVKIRVLNSPQCLNSDTSDDPNNMDLDSDNDRCFDVIEAGFGDRDTDGDGMIDNLVGFTYPEPLDRNNNGIKDYLEYIPVTFRSNAQNLRIRENTNASFTFRTTNQNLTDITIIWQESRDNGITWNDLSDTAPYNGTTTNNLVINNVPLSFNNYKYRALITNVTNICLRPLETEALLQVREPLKPIGLPDGFSPNNDGIYVCV